MSQARVCHGGCKLSREWSEDLGSVAVLRTKQESPCAGVVVDRSNGPVER
jgi:hypothetical protein